MAAQGRRRQRCLVLPRRRQRRRRAHRRAGARRLHCAAAAHVHRSHLRGVRPRLLLGVARGRREADLRVGSGQLLRTPHQHLAPVLQRQPVATGAVVLGHRPAPAFSAVEHRALHLRQQLQLRRPLPGRARLLQRRGQAVPRPGLGNQLHPGHPQAAALRVEEPGRRRHQRVHGHGLGADGIPRVPLRIGLLQEVPPPRPGRAPLHHRGRGLRARPAGRRGARPLRLEGRQPLPVRRRPGPVAAPTLQRGRDARHLPGDEPGPVAEVRRQPLAGPGVHRAPHRRGQRQEGRLPGGVRGRETPRSTRSSRKSWPSAASPAG